MTERLGENLSLAESIVDMAFTQSLDQNCAVSSLQPLGREKVRIPACSMLIPQRHPLFPMASEHKRGEGHEPTKAFLAYWRTLTMTVRQLASAADLPPRPRLDQASQSSLGVKEGSSGERYKEARKAELERLYVEVDYVRGELDKLQPVMKYSTSAAWCQVLKDGSSERSRHATLTATRCRKSWRPKALSRV